MIKFNKERQQIIQLSQFSTHSAHYLVEQKVDFDLITI